MIIDSKKIKKKISLNAYNSINKVDNKKIEEMWAKEIYWFFGDKRTVLAPPVLVKIFIVSSFPRFLNIPRCSPSLVIFVKYFLFVSKDIFFVPLSAFEDNKFV